MEDIYDLQEKIVTRQDFSRFVDELSKDLEYSKHEWENDDLRQFLEAMSAYAIDVQGFYDNSGQDVDANLPSWKTFAQILLGAKVYE